MSEPPVGELGGCPKIGLVSFTTNEILIGGVLSTKWFRLRTVRETFASHSSSLSKAKLVRADPLRDGKRYILRTYRISSGQLGNTDLRPF